MAGQYEQRPLTRSLQSPVMGFSAMHSTETPQKRVAEIFRCFLAFNKFSFINHGNLVPNLEKILQNVSSRYKILVKFLDS